MSKKDYIEILPEEEQPEDFRVVRCLFCGFIVAIPKEIKGFLECPNCREGIVEDEQ